MSETRRHEVEEMDQWELQELVEQIRDIVWFGEDATDVIKSIRDLVGVHEDVEDTEDYDSIVESDDEDSDDDPDELDLEKDEDDDVGGYDEPLDED